MNFTIVDVGPVGCNRHEFSVFCGGEVIGGMLFRLRRQSGSNLIIGAGPLLIGANYLNLTGHRRVIDINKFDDCPWISTGEHQFEVRRNEGLRYIVDKIINKWCDARGKNTSYTIDYEPLDILDAFMIPFASDALDFNIRIEYEAGQIGQRDSYTAFLGDRQIGYAIVRGNEVELTVTKWATGYTKDQYVKCTELTHKVPYESAILNQAALKISFAFMYQRAVLGLPFNECTIYTMSPNEDVTADGLIWKKNTPVSLNMSARIKEVLAKKVENKELGRVQLSGLSFQDIVLTFDSGYLVVSKK
ncbi:hypothetical protein [Yersinia phage MHG19]|nr:hypothetical protein [Yersinia phage MHG19]